MLEHEFFDGFSVVLEPYNNQWKAYFIENPSIYGVSEYYTEAVVRLKEKWELYKNEVKKNGENLPISVAEKKFGGGFNVRLNEDLHRALVNEAIHSNLSLNALIQKKLYQCTVTEKRKDIWKLVEISQMAQDLSLYLFFSCGEKEVQKVILKLYQHNLADILGDDSVSSMEKLKKCIEKHELNEPFQKFIQSEYYNGVIGRQELIQSFLISSDEIRRVMSYVTPNLEKKFPEKGAYYIFKVVR